MCSTCGCGDDHDVRYDGAPVGRHHHVSSALWRMPGPGAVDVDVRPISRIVQIERNLLEENDRHAEANRAGFRENGVFAVNLVSSPGAGKTTLLVETLTRLAGQPLGVIEGDQQTSNDADRIRGTGASAVQINTGKGCHLDAHMVSHALERLALPPGALLFIENVGNLVCPAEFDLGEAAKVVILSVTEGDDKPLKYPDMFAASKLLIINKIDLIPYVDFDIGRCVEYARRINPELEVLQVSAKSGEGLREWMNWIQRRDPEASVKAAGL